MQIAEIALGNTQDAIRLWIDTAKELAEFDHLNWPTLLTPDEMIPGWTGESKWNWFNRSGWATSAGGFGMPPVSNDPARFIDLSQIDFEALQAEFQTGRKPIEVQKPRAKIAMKLAQMVKLNRTRMDFLEEFQKMIDDYNAGSSNAETTFARLMAFTRRLNVEEKRGIAEQLSEEELVIFDLLTKPDVPLTKHETAEVKKVARALLEKLKQEKLVLDWRKQQTTRAMVFTTIREVLDELPRAYTKDLYDAKCDTVYQHFYEAYLGQGKSVYAGG